MTIQRTSGPDRKEDFGLIYLLNNVTSEISPLSVEEREEPLVNIGGGFGDGPSDPTPNNSEQRLGNYRRMTPSGFGFNYGDWTIIPQKTFIGEVKLWGAGGGSHGNGRNSSAGGGGHTRGEVTFLEGVPYTFWVGQGGSRPWRNYSTNGARWTYRANGTFGNGGAGGVDGGSGGGLSGLFFNTLGNDGGPGGGHNNGGYGTSDYAGGISTWFRSPSQNNALLIAGGGGGAGHHNSNHHGQGGGGGGTQGNVGHNSGRGTQSGGGSGGYNSAQAGFYMHGGSGGNGSHGGGGGGGWFGGGGGGHTSNHYNGGGGGSGHALDLHSTTGFRNFWIKEKYGEDFVRNSFTETSPSDHGNRVNMSAGRGDKDWDYAGLGGGFGNTVSNTNNSKFIGYHSPWYTGMNGRFVLRVIS
jgi:hypothetical protein